MQLVHLVIGDGTGLHVGDGPPAPAIERLSPHASVAAVHLHSNDIPVDDEGVVDSFDARKDHLERHVVGLRARSAASHVAILNADCRARPEVYGANLDRGAVQRIRPQAEAGVGKRRNDERSASDRLRKVERAYIARGNGAPGPVEEYRASGGDRDVGHGNALQNDGAWQVDAGHVADTSRQQFRDVDEIAVVRPEGSHRSISVPRLVSVCNSVAVGIDNKRRGTDRHLHTVRKPIPVRVAAGWVRLVDEALVRIGKAVAVRVGRVARGDERRLACVRTREIGVLDYDERIASASRDVDGKDLGKLEEVCARIDIDDVVDRTLAEGPGEHHISRV